MPPWTTPIARSANKPSSVGTTSSSKTSTSSSACSRDMPRRRRPADASRRSRTKSCINSSAGCSNECSAAKPSPALRNSPPQGVSSPPDETGLVHRRENRRQIAQPGERARGVAVEYEDRKRIRAVTRRVLIHAGAFGPHPELEDDVTVQRGLAIGAIEQGLAFAAQRNIGGAGAARAARIVTPR